MPGAIPAYFNFRGQSTVYKAGKPPRQEMKKANEEEVMCHQQTLLVVFAIGDNSTAKSKQLIGVDEGLASGVLRPGRNDGANCS